MRYKLSVILAGTLLLSACMPFKSPPPPTVYALHGPSVARQQVKKDIMHIIVVGEPAVPAGFDTNKIALYLDNGRRLDYYARAVWPDSLSKVLQDVIMQSANKLPDMMAVNPEAGIPAAYELSVKVNDFEPVYAAGPDAPPQLKVSLSFRLLSAARRTVILDETLSATAPAAENRQTAIVSGLEALLRHVDARALRDVHRAL